MTKSYDLPPRSLERQRAKKGIHRGELKTGLGNNSNAAIIKTIIGTGRAEFENTLLP